MPRFQSSPEIGYDISTYKNETLIGLRQATIDVFHNDLFFINLYTLKFYLISFDLAFCSFSLLARQQTEPKEKALFSRYFSVSLKTRFIVLKSFQGFIDVANAKQILYW